MAAAMKMLAGKIALVTGASRGIGRACALALGRAGARVLVHYARAEEEANAVVAEIRLLGGNAVTRQIFINSRFQNIVMPTYGRSCWLLPPVKLKKSSCCIPAEKRIG